MSFVDSVHCVQYVFEMHCTFLETQMAWTTAVVLHAVHNLQGVKKNTVYRHLDYRNSEQMHNLLSDN